MKAAVQLAGEAPRALGIVVRRAVRVEGYADHQRIGFPLSDELANGVEASRAGSSDGVQRRRRMRHRIARRDADALRAEIKSEE